MNDKKNAFRQRKIPLGEPGETQRQILCAVLTNQESRGKLRRCALARVGHLVCTPQERAYLAEELLAITTLEVLRCADRFLPEHDPLPWIKAFIRRISLRLTDQHLRDRKQWVSLDVLRRYEESAVESARLPQYLRRYEAVEDTVLDALENHRLLETVSTLDKDILFAYYLWGESYNDIARKLNLKPEAVRQRACRAIRRLEASRKRAGEDARDDLIPLHKTIRLRA